MRATLGKLLTEYEGAFLFKHPTFEYDYKIQIKDLTVKQLSDMALILFETEYGNRKVPSMPLSALAIKILTKRAIEKNLPIL